MAERTLDDFEAVGGGRAGHTLGGERQERVAVGEDAVVSGGWQRRAPEVIAVVGLGDLQPYGIGLVFVLDHIRGHSLTVGRERKAVDPTRGIVGETQHDLCLREHVALVARRIAELQAGLGAWATAAPTANHIAAIVAATVAAPARGTAGERECKQAGSKAGA